MERANLYAAICANPRDDLPKLVFADWLDETGDAVDRAHAELIRIQCDWDANARGYERALEPYTFDVKSLRRPDAELVAKEDPEAAQAIKMLNRAEALEAAVKSKSPVPLRQIEGVSYRHSGRIRGLRNKLRVSLEQTWEVRISEIAAGLPLRDLWVDAKLGPRFEPWDHRRFDRRVLDNLEFLTSEKATPSVLSLAILASPWLVHLKSLKRIRSDRQNEFFDILERAEHLAELETIEIDQFAGSGPARTFNRFHENIVRNLRRFRVGFNNWGVPYNGLPLILQFSGAGTKLEELEISNIPDADDIAGVLSRGGIDATNVISLGLTSGELGARGACDLLTSNCLPALRHLDIGENPIGELVGRRLERTESFPDLHSLALRGCQLARDGFASLTNWKGFGGLRKLVLSDNGCDHASVQALISSDAPNLHTLGLANCNLHGSHVRELVRSRFVRSLWNLDLRGNFLDDAFIRALIETPFLDALQCLLVDVTDGDPGYDRLKTRFGDRFQSS